jgi:hypothetical protein
METIKAWQCIGCGKLEAPQTCIGVCQDRRVELVYASEHAAVVADLARTKAQRDALAAVLDRVASLDVADAAAVRALCDAAREAVDHLDEAPPPAPPPVTDAGPLRDRRNVAPDAVEAKPHLRRPATLLVR